MKTLTKITLLSLTFTLILGTTYATTQKFKDDNQIPTWARSSVQNLMENGVFNGYENGNFGPHDSVTRAQLAVILEKYQHNYLHDYSKVLMNYKYFENTKLDYEVKTALVLAIAGKNTIKEPSNSNDYALGISCNFKDSSLQDYGMIKRIISNEIPKSYTVYNCDTDIHYGGGYYIHHLYEGGIPGSGNTGKIDRWHGPFAPDILLSN